MTHQHQEPQTIMLPADIDTDANEVEIETEQSPTADASPTPGASAPPQPTTSVPPVGAATSFPDVVIAERLPVECQLEYIKQVVIERERTERERTRERERTKRELIAANNELRKLVLEREGINALLRLEQVQTTTASSSSASPSSSSPDVADHPPPAPAAPARVDLTNEQLRCLLRSTRENKNDVFRDNIETLRKNEVLDKKLREKLRNVHNVSCKDNQTSLIEKLWDNEKRKRESDRFWRDKKQQAPKRQKKAAADENCDTDEANNHHQPRDPTRASPPSASEVPVPPAPMVVDDDAAPQADVAGTATMCTAVENMAADAVPEDAMAHGAEEVHQAAVNDQAHIVCGEEEQTRAALSNAADVEHMYIQMLWKQSALVADEMQGRATLRDEENHGHIELLSAADAVHSYIQMVWNQAALVAEERQGRAALSDEENRDHIQLLSEADAEHSHIQMLWNQAALVADERQGRAAISGEENHDNAALHRMHTELRRRRDYAVSDPWWDKVLNLLFQYKHPKFSNATASILLFGVNNETARLLWSPPYSHGVPWAISDLYTICKNVVTAVKELHSEIRKDFMVYKAVNPPVVFLKKSDKFAMTSLRLLSEQTKSKSFQIIQKCRSGAINFQPWNRRLPPMFRVYDREQLVCDVVVLRRSMLNQMLPSKTDITFDTALLFTEPQWLEIDKIVQWIMYHKEYNDKFALLDATPVLRFWRMDYFDNLELETTLSNMMKFAQVLADDARDDQIGKICAMATIDNRFACYKSALPYLTRAAEIIHWARSHR